MMAANNIQRVRPDNINAQISPVLVRQTMQVLAGKWKLQIITSLINNGKARFMEVQRGVEGISSKILSSELQEMEKDKMVFRIVHDAKLTIVEYELTDHGQALDALLYCLVDWGDKHFKIIDNY